MKKQVIVFFLFLITVFALVSIFLGHLFSTIVMERINVFSLLLFDQGTERVDLSIDAIIDNLLSGGVILNISVFLFALFSGISIWLITRSYRINDLINMASRKGQKAISTDDEKGSARFQSEKEKVKNIPNWVYKYGDPNSRPKSGGVVFGMVKEGENERVFAETGDKHTLGIGTTGSGKGRCVIAQTIWNIGLSGESMIVTDPKGELFKQTVPFLEKEGYEVHLINLDEPQISTRWDILHYLKKYLLEGDIDKAMDKATDIAQIHCAKGKKAQSDPLWYESAVAVIKALTTYVSLECKDENKQHMGSIYNLLLERGSKEIPDEEDKTELDVLFEKLDINHPSKKPYALKQLSGGNTSSSINVSTAGYIQMYNSDSAIRLTSTQDFAFEDIGRKKVAVFLKIPHDKETYNDLASLFVQQSYSALIEYGESVGGRLKNNVHYILDEFGNLPPIPSFATKVTVARSYGIRLHIWVQALDQIKKHYKDDYNVIVGNCDNKIYLYSKDKETNKEISETMGKYTRVVKTVTENLKHGLERNQYTRNHNKESVALKTPDELGMLRYGEMILLRSREYPSEMTSPDLSQWYANKIFGLAPPTDDVEKDKEENRRILEERNKLLHRYRYEKKAINYFLGNDMENTPIETPVTPRNQEIGEQTSSHKEQGEESNSARLDTLLGRLNSPMSIDSGQKQSESKKIKSSDNIISNIINDLFDSEDDMFKDEKADIIV